MEIKLPAADLVESFSNHDGDGNVNEKGKKAIGLISKTNTLHVYLTFLYISLPSLKNYDVKMPNFTFYGEHKSDDELFFPFLNLSPVPKKSTPGKFAYVRHFQLE